MLHFWIWVFERWVLIVTFKAKKQNDEVMRLKLVKETNVIRSSYVAEMLPAQMQYAKNMEYMIE